MIEANLKNRAEATYELINSAVALGENSCGATIASPPSVLDYGEMSTGQVKIVGGVRGYINPKRGEHSTILIRTGGSGLITIRIYDMRGVLIREMTRVSDGTGMDVMHWDGCDSTGRYVAPGLYPVVITGPGVHATDRLAVLR